jgi:GntR family transcriptional repressor for pyruvate dehydrogenase complex
MFEKPKQNRVYQDVVDQVQSAILDGRLKEGDFLPPGPKLQEMLGVSRGTLREALRILEQKGLIEVRLGTGGGAVVKGAGTAQITESLASLIRSKKVSLEDLARFRADVEGIVTGTAAELAGKKEIKDLEALLSQAQDCCRQGLSAWKEFIRIDEKMHMTLAEIARNPLYRFILRTVHDNIHQYYDQYLPGSVPEMKENLKDLEKIVKAVAAGKAKKAQKLARDHVYRFNLYMQKRRRKVGLPKNRSRRHVTAKRGQDRS